MRFAVSGFAAFLALLAGCSRPAAISRVEWTVMGTVAAVQWKGEERPEIEIVRQTFAEVERLLNAHDPNSEISRLAPLSDEEVLARSDALVRACYAAAFEMRKATQGRFNPRWRGEKTLDLGAIAKGYAVDLAAERLRDVAFPVLIDLGGNLKAVKGEWRVAIANTEGVLTLAPGASCATSAEYFRGKHIRDGISGGEVTNGIYSVTVVDPESAMRADALSTVMFLLGETAGAAFLKSHYPVARAFWYNLPNSDKRKE